MLSSALQRKFILQSILTVAFSHFRLDALLGRENFISCATPLPRCCLGFPRCQQCGGPEVTTAFLQGFRVRRSYARVWDALCVMLVYEHQTNARKQTIDTARYPLPPSVSRIYQVPERHPLLFGERHIASSRELSPDLLGFARISPMKLGASLRAQRKLVKLLSPRNHIENKERRHPPFQDMFPPCEEARTHDCRYSLPLYICRELVTS